MIETKVCKKCGIEKPLTEFHKDKSKKDGHRIICKECRIPESSKYYKDNKDEISKRSKTYYKENKDKIIKHVRQYSKENKEKIAERGKKYRKENKEKLSERRKKYYKENKDKIAEYMKHFYKENKDRISEYKHQHYENNKELYYISGQKRRAKKQSLQNDLTDKQWESIVDYFNYECVLSQSIENLSLEHFLPLNICHGGTTISNVYPMELSLNISKSVNNPFEWIKTQPKEYQDNFYDILVPYMAEVNEMNIEEFEDYTYWCFEHPRTLEQVKEDNKKGLTSKDLYYNSMLTKSL